MSFVVLVDDSDDINEVEVGCTTPGLVATVVEGRLNEVVAQISAPQDNVVLKPIVTRKKRMYTYPPRTTRSVVSGP